MRLTREMIEKIQEAIEPIEYGSLHITFVGHLDSIDIDVTERIRIKKGNPRAGEIHV
jgi:hypothetical protein